MSFELLRLVFGNGRLANLDLELEGIVFLVGSYHGKALLALAQGGLATFDLALAVPLLLFLNSRAP